MLDAWNDIYLENKKLDSIFERKYAKVGDYFEKNAIEFLVELGEFVNETKCFKYWTIKSPDKSKVLEEFADCITMILFFFNKLNLDLEDIPKHIDEDNILYLINYLYIKGTNLINNCTDKLVKDIFSNLVYLSKLLNLDENDILNAIRAKHKIINTRLNSEY